MPVSVHMVIIAYREICLSNISTAYCHETGRFPIVLLQYTVLQDSLLLGPRDPSIKTSNRTLPSLLNLMLRPNTEIKEQNRSSEKPKKSSTTQNMSQGSGDPPKLAEHQGRAPI